MGAGHHHAHGHHHVAPRAGERHRRPLLIALALTASFFLVELVGGLLTGSLALLGDAGHMLTDVLGLTMALAAITLASRHEQRTAPTTAATPHTFGLYRLEILAAFANALILFAVAIWVLIEAGRRLAGDPEVETTPMLVVAVLGLLVNLVCFQLLRAGAKESLNLQGASLEVLADAVGSVGVIVAAVVTIAFGWSWADPAIAAAIGLWILPRTWKLGSEAARVLLQSAPAGVNLPAMQHELAALPGVVDVHDLHVWTLTSEMDAASAHLMTQADADPHAVLDQARELLASHYGIAHATFQVEPETHRGCADLHW